MGSERVNPSTDHIPRHWELPGISHSDMTVSALRVGNEGFISYTLPDNTAYSKSAEGAMYKGEYAELFFGPDGKVTDFLQHKGWDTSIRIGNMHFHFRETREPPKYSPFNFFRFRQPRESYKHPDLKITFMGSKETGGRLGIVEYENGKLKEVVIGKPVVGGRVTDSDQPAVESEGMVVISVNEAGKPSIDGRWGEERDHNTVVWRPEDGMIVDSWGEVCFSTEVESTEDATIIVRQIDERRKDEGWVVEREIRVPKELNMKKINEVVYGKRTDQATLLSSGWQGPNWKRVPDLVGATANVVSRQV